MNGESCTLPGRRLRMKPRWISCRLLWGILNTCQEKKSIILEDWTLRKSHWLGEGALNDRETSKTHTISCRGIFGTCLQGDFLYISDLKVLRSLSSAFVFSFVYCILVFSTIWMAFHGENIIFPWAWKGVWEFHCFRHFSEKQPRFSQWIWRSLRHQQFSISWQNKCLHFSGVARTTVVAKNQAVWMLLFIRDRVADPSHGKLNGEKQGYPRRTTVGGCKILESADVHLSVGELT